ncbi:Abnormal spindle-like microcephaly-associated protein, partial [Clonorchis sinensis]
MLQNEPRIGDYQGCPIRWGSLLLMTQHIGNPGISNSSELFVTRASSRCIPMNSPKVRKSWFCGSPTTTQLHVSGVSKTLGPDLNCQLLVTATDENREPICVTASDVLTLTTFSPRAVVDFGTENFTNRPFVRYLLLENPHNEDQCVSIRRGLPPDEFMLAWIESEHTLPTQSDLSWKTPGYQLPTFSSSAPNSICVRGPHGRCLLRISWNPSQPQSSDNGGGGFYHIIQFRVNDAFPLQALVVGRLLPPVMERKTRLKRPQRLQPTVFSMPRGITALQRTCSYDRFHSSQTPLPTPSLIEQSQRGGLERSLSVQYFDEDSASFERPKHGVKEIFPGRAQTTTVQTAVVGDAVPERVSRVSSAHFQSTLRRQSVSLPRPPGPKCTVLDEFSAPPAFFSHKTRSAALSLTLANDTDVGFVSPKLIRSPALKRDPQLTLKNEPSGTYYSGQAGCNLFYPYISYSLSELSERGLTQWLNSVFAPCIAANSDAISGEIPSGLGGRAYWVSLNNAVDMLHTPIMTGPGQRVEREVDEGKIVPMYDLSFRVDKGAKRRLMNQLTVNYSPIWLHLALDALIGAPVPKSAHISPTDGILKLSDPTRLAPPPVPLSQKLRIYLFTASSVSKHIATSVPAQSKKPTANPIPQKPAVNRDQLHNRHTIKRFLVLLWFLDRLKSNRLVEYNPCLFRFRSHVKSSAEMALLFARNFLTGENNLVRHLANLGVHLEVTQTPLDEYELTVSNLAVDLRDGIRLVKLAELLLPLMPNSKSRSGDYLAPATLMSLVRFPVISRLQKIHNVGLALKAFERHGRLCMADGTEIDPRDVVNGHREKSLALLWCLLLRYQVLSLVDVGLLNEEIERLRSMPTGDKVSDSSGGEETGTHSDDVVHMKLFLWASLVCRLYQVEVLNLDESFSDGRALCVLLHHYLPTLLPGGLIRHLTTSTASSYRLARHTPHLTRTSRYNLQLF